MMNGDTELKYQHFRVRLVDGRPEELGRGAMGVTYRAYDSNLEVPVALKVISPALLKDEKARERFLREARAAASLRHANVATVLYLGEQDTEVFYAMEFVEGETVADFVRREKAVPAELALRIAEQVAAALVAAESHGLVHRDLKPANIMLSTTGDGELLVKVIDFGLAKGIRGVESDLTLTQGGFIGTPLFASPEQLAEQEVDIRSDIYSLGITLFTMLIGHAPFVGSTAQVMSQHLYRDPPWDQIAGQPEPVVKLIRQMLAKDPDDRPTTAAELRKMIRECLQEVDSRLGPAVATTPRDSKVSLLDVVRHRGGLPLRDVLPILRLVAERLDATDISGQPVPRLGLGDIVLCGISEPGSALGEVSDVTFAGAGDSETSATMSAGAATIIRAGDDIGEGWPARRVAELAYAAIGGTHFDSGVWIPLAELTESGNRLIRDVLVQRTRTARAVRFVEALEASGTSDMVPAVRPVELVVEVPVARQAGTRRLPLVTIVLVAALLAGLGAIAFVVGRNAIKGTDRPTYPESTDHVAVATPPPSPTPEDPEEVAKRSAEEEQKRKFAAARDRELAGDLSGALEAYAGIEGSGAWAAMEAIVGELDERFVAGIPDEEFQQYRPALEAAAKRHVVAAQMLLGKGLQRTDPEQSLLWIVKAARNGRSDAMVLAGLMYSNADGVAKADFREAAAWFQRAADLDNDYGLFCLGECYLYGYGVTKDPDRAAELLGRSAELGNARAMTLLGDLYQDGIGVPRDLRQAMAFYEAAAAQGNWVAQGNLGVLLMKGGKGLKRDPVRAINLWKEGANAGDPFCMYLYGLSLIDPRNGNNPREGRKWVQSAADAGSELAQQWLSKNPR